MIDTAHRAAQEINALAEEWFDIKLVTCGNC
jgi:hypothetical protein